MFEKSIFLASTLNRATHLYVIYFIFQILSNQLNDLT